jgi:histone-lysine N-methyltransferase SETMAR
MQTGRWLQGVLLLLDNTLLHSVAHTKETHQKLKFEALGHPLCSPDLAPSDFHLFGPLKKALSGCQIADDNEVKDVMHKWPCTQPTKFLLVV